MYFKMPLEKKIITAHEALRPTFGSRPTSSETLLSGQMRRGSWRVDREDEKTCHERRTVACVVRKWWDKITRSFSCCCGAKFCVTQQSYALVTSCVPKVDPLSERSLTDGFRNHDSTPHRCSVSCQHRQHGFHTGVNI